MKSNSHRWLFRVIIVFVALFVLAGSGLAGLVFLRHEKRQNQDITDALTISKQAKRAIDEIEPDPEYISLWSSSEKELSRLFAENCTLNGFQKLSCGQDVSMLIVGDSIGAQQWPADVASWIEKNYRVNCSLKNISLGGNYSFSGFTTLERLQDDITYDIVIICYGQNDSNDGFASDYEALLRLVLEKYKHVSVISVLESPQREYTAKMKAIQQIAGYYSVPVADTIAAYDRSGLSYESLTFDGVHPNEAGQEIYAETVKAIIVDSVAEENARRNAMIVSCLLEGEKLDFSQFDSSIALLPPMGKDIEEYSRFRYYPASEFTRLSNTEWQIQLKNVSGKLGIDKGRCHEYNDFQVYLNDQEIYSEQDYQTIEYTLRRISHVTDFSLPLDGMLRIHFYSDECADAFYGLVITDYKER